MTDRIFILKYFYFYRLSATNSIIFFTARIVAGICNPGFFTIRIFNPDYKSRQPALSFTLLSDSSIGTELPISY